MCFFAGNSTGQIDMPLAFLSVALVMAIVLLSLMNVFEYFINEYRKIKKEKKDE